MDAPSLFALCLLLASVATLFASDCTALNELPQDSKFHDAVKVPRLLNVSVVIKSTDGQPCTPVFNKDITQYAHHAWTCKVSRWQAPATWFTCSPVAEILAEVSESRDPCIFFAPRGELCPPYPTWSARKTSDSTSPMAPATTTASAYSAKVSSSITAITITTTATMFSTATSTGWSTSTAVTTTIEVTTSTTTTNRIFYRFTSTKSRDGSSNRRRRGTEGDFQVSEIAFIYNGSIVDTSAVSSTYEVGGGGQPGNAFDLNPNSKVCCTMLPVIVEFPYEQPIDGYRFTTGNDVLGRDPVQFILESSSDGMNWYTRHAQSTDYPTPSRRKTATEWFSIQAASRPAPTGTFYKFTSTKSREGSFSRRRRRHKGDFQVSEIAFIYMGRIVNTSAVNSTYEVGGGGGQPGNAFDLNSNSKVCCTIAAVIVEFPFEQPIDGYRFTTGDDVPNRDPVQFILESSSDGLNWYTRHVQSTDYPTPTRRKTATEWFSIQAASTPAPTKAT